jgi:excisionase family DNA binding protein
VHTETDLLALARHTLGDLADRPALRVEDCAHLLGVSRSAAYEAVRTGQIPSWRIGRRILVPVAALIGRLAGVESPRTPFVPATERTHEGAGTHAHAL